MRLRQAVFRWLIPAAFVMPLWLFIGWGATGAGGWAFLFLLIAIPAVFAAQLLLTLLVRVRASVRVERAVSWLDAAGFLLWHLALVVVGLFPQGWFGLAVVAAVLLAIALAWSSLWQLWRETRDAGGIRMPSVRMPRSERPADAEGVYVIHESPHDPR